MSEQLLYFQRVREIRKEKKLSIQAVADMTGLSKSAISMFETGTSSISTDNFLSICAALGANVGWVMTGRGVKYESEEIHNSSIAEQSNHKIISTELARQDGLPAHAIPLYDIDINASNVQRLIDDNNDVPLVGWIHLEGEDANGLIGVRAKGNSMATFINGGDTMLIRKLGNLRFVPFGEAYVIITGERTVVKYIRAGPTDTTWTLRSHNNEVYQDFPIHKEDVRHLFVVVKVLKELTY